MAVLALAGCGDSTAGNAGTPGYRQTSRPVETGPFEVPTPSSNPKAPTTAPSTAAVTIPPTPSTTTPAIPELTTDDTVCRALRPILVTAREVALNERPLEDLRDESSAALDRAADLLEEDPKILGVLTSQLLADAARAAAEAVGSATTEREMSRGYLILLEPSDEATATALVAAREHLERECPGLLSAFGS